MTDTNTDVSGGNTSPPDTSDDKKKVRYRHWCFTDFTLEEMKWDAKTMRYLIIGLEQCPTTNNWHHQGYVYFKNARAFNGLKKKYPKVSWRKCDGTAKENIVYCSKEGDFEEWGERPRQGARNDIKQITETIEEGASNREILIEFGDKALHIYKGIEWARECFIDIQPRTWMTCGIWYWGATGTGKSHIVFKDYDPKTHYVWSDDNGWWDLYNGQEIVIMNDFRGEIPYNKLLQLIDKWPMVVNRRGKAPIQFIAKEIRITSSLPPYYPIY